MAKIVTVELVLDVKTASEATDAVNEILREEQRSSFSPDSRLIDYQIGQVGATVTYDEAYEEGDAFL